MIKENFGNLVRNRGRCIVKPILFYESSQLFCTRMKVNGLMELYEKFRTPPLRFGVFVHCFVIVFDIICYRCNEHVGCDLNRKTAGAKEKQRKFHYEQQTGGNQVTSRSFRIKWKSIRNMHHNKIEMFRRCQLLNLEISIAHQDGNGNSNASSPKSVV